jgi:hypothetical protein
MRPSPPDLLSGDDLLEHTLQARRSAGEDRFANTSSCNVRNLPLAEQARLRSVTLRDSGSAHAHPEVSQAAELLDVLRGGEHTDGVSDLSGDAALVTDEASVVSEEEVLPGALRWLLVPRLLKTRRICDDLDRLVSHARVPPRRR